MRRFRYRCTVCRTTSPVTLGVADLAAEIETHRQTIHGGHIPDDEMTGEIDRLGRWYAALSPLAALHARIADEFSDFRDDKTMGHYWWATAGATLLIAGGAALALLLVVSAL
ncbi:hypothetical protein [Streptomyces clavuligerus]|uniref:hypothetical protein n=1 Tax=Streptomyces clavuligerus TaxID=1901 RepID=UPI00017FF4C8|nr:hypothetical protein [Streptomyces clavuligerus]AXU16804.1 hypothetical protein D1794_28965 [Streptomyces clavuligerus]EDY48793.1 conserved hypothetical protein [Streptomyces clavuligerus]MBY6300935.1 hypothetical protein [Streptomyces clavuligerus]QPJ97049.1 hypothetical protein GE265_28490 [Streptomyces clavuligerus]WDN55746.1 hypothetical protein LL058_28005 [Streptomyces clavuligerus]